jgi:flagellar biosynthetic protein FlhB
MADHESQERTEQPTQKRLEEARRRGYVPRSRELSTTAVMLAGAGAFIGSGTFIATGFANEMRTALQASRDGLLAPDAMQAALGAAVLVALQCIAPVLLATLVAALLAPLGVGGWNVSFRALAPDWSRLSPTAGARRIFGMSGWVELGKALAKCLVVGGIGTAIVMWLMNSTLLVGRMDPVRGIASAIHLIALALILMSAALAIIAAIDVPWQLWHYNKQLQMTRQEMRDELKETEGRPEIKQRIHAMRQQLTRRRSLPPAPRTAVAGIDREDAGATHARSDA